MLGVIIIGVLLTLSQVIESYQKVTYDHGPMMEMLPDGTTQISDEHRMATTRVPVYSFIPFLNTYYLHWVLVIGLGLVTASVVCFAKYRRKIKTRRKNRGLPKMQSPVFYQFAGSSSPGNTSSSRMYFS